MSPSPSPSPPPGPPVADLDHLVVVRLWALLDAFEGRLRRELAAIDMTLAGFRLIGEVMRSPEGLGQAELARRLGVRAPTVSAAVSRLEAAGLVVRGEDPEDPRAYRIRLASAAPLQRGVALLAGIEADLVGDLGAAEQARLYEWLGRAAERLSAQSTEDP